MKFTQHYPHTHTTTTTTGSNNELFNVTTILEIEVSRFESLLLLNSCL